MKIFRSESIADYKTYTFNYAIYCQQENEYEIDEIYNLGFLPYSNNLDLKIPTYYLARSLRVELERFVPTSENRRVIKKMNELNPSIQVVDKKDFKNDDSFQKFCLDYASIRFDGAMPKERFNYIYHWKPLQKIFQFTDVNNNLLGYVFAIVTDKSLHYWFSFYNMEYSRMGLGKWMMFSVIEWAKQNHLQNVYLGTCYGEKAMYKMRDFKGLAFFDGNTWNQDMKLLKQKCKTDNHFVADDFKQS
jgi:arginine-tRNA-protein transferase